MNTEQNPLTRRRASDAPRGTRADDTPRSDGLPQYVVDSRIRDPDLLRRRRQVIVRVALELFAEKGFHQTSVDEIAEGAGMTIGSLYKYVPSKQDLLSLINEAQTFA